mgnify:CR=1 FL=1
MEVERSKHAWARSEQVEIAVRRVGQAVQHWEMHYILAAWELKVVVLVLPICMDPNAQQAILVLCLHSHLVELILIALFVLQGMLAMYRKIVMVW